MGALARVPPHSCEARESKPEQSGLGFGRGPGGAEIRERTHLGCEEAGELGAVGARGGDFARQATLVIPGAEGRHDTAATQADALEAAAVVVAGGAVGQTGTSIITKNSRIRKIRVTPKGELPLPVQTGLALALPASFLFSLISFLAYL